MTKNLLIVALLTLNVVFGYHLYNNSQMASEPFASTARTNAPTKTTTRRQTQEPVLNSRTKPDSFDTTFDLDGNYLDIAAALRDEGFTEMLVRQMVFSRIKQDLIDQDDQFAKPYWDSEFGREDEDTVQKLRRLTDQRLALIDVFGEEIVDDPLFADLFKPLNDRLPFLNSDKQIALFEIQQKRYTGSRFMGGGIQESREEFMAKQREFDDAIAQILSPDELLEYNLRESRIAQIQRYRTPDFDYTEQEFREIYRIKNLAFENISPGDREAFRQQQEIANERIADYLGSTRFAELERAQDGAFRTLKAIGELYGNSDREVIEMYNETTEARDSISLLEADNSIDLDTRRQKREEIWEDTVRRIEKIAGEDTANSVKNNERRLGLTRRRQNSQL